MRRGEFAVVVVFLVGMKKRFDRQRRNRLAGTIGGSCSDEQNDQAASHVLTRSRRGGCLSQSMNSLPCGIGLKRDNRDE